MSERYTEEMLDSFRYLGYCYKSDTFQGVTTMHARNYKIVLIVLLSSLFIIASVAFAQEQKYKDYTIQKGDTLWDISNDELNDPFLWPKIWKENPHIKNPDFILPRQKIKIPLHIIQKEIIAQPKPRPKFVQKPERKIEIKVPEVQERPVTKIIAQEPKQEYLIDKNLLTVTGYITDSVSSVGVIYDTPAETTQLIPGDYAYIRTDNPVKKGDTFYIIYPVEKVKHPVTGANLGTRIAILGTAELVEEQDPKILITKSYVEIPIGSLLDTYYEIKPPLNIPNPRKPDVDGYIVTSLRRLKYLGTENIVFIDKGSNDGLEVGDLLATTTQNSQHKIMNGLIQVINTKPSTAAAIIRKTTREVHRGDGITAVMPEQ